jgi:hypothetical protein
LIIIDLQPLGIFLAALYVSGYRGGANILRRFVQEKIIEVVAGARLRDPRLVRINPVPVAGTTTILRSGVTTLAALVLKPRPLIMPIVLPRRSDKLTARACRSPKKRFGVPAYRTIEKPLCFQAAGTVLSERRSSGPFMDHPPYPEPSSSRLHLH